MKFILKAIGEYIFGTLFFMGAFVTIVGAGVIDWETAGGAVRTFYWAGVATFATSIGILIVRFIASDGADH